MLQKLILLSTICLFAAPAFATEADFEKRMARGVAALEAGDATRAQEEFQAAVKEHPDDPEASLNLAIALNRANDPAAESALKTALRVDPGNLRINLELGTFYYNQKMYEDSGDYFENLVALKPDPEIKTVAEGYLANIRSLNSGKRWAVTLTGGMQYDSNVPLAADPSLLPAGTSRISDWKWIINPSISGVAYRDSRQELTAGYSFYQSVHLNMSDYDLTQNALNVTYKRLFSPLFSAKLSGDFESVLLGGNPFLNDFSITPGVSLTLDEKIIGLEYRFRNSYFKNSDAYPSNTDRDGVTHSVVLSYHHPFSETLNLRVGYTFDRTITDVSAWSYISHQGSAGLAVSLPHAFLLDFSMEATGSKYDDILTGATDIRSDTTLTGGVSLLWQLSDHLGLSLGYQYTDNTSNISSYGYTRSVTSIMAQGRY